MPLVQGASESARRENVRRLLREGYPQDQAIAIAAEVQRRARSRRRFDQNERAERLAREAALLRRVVRRRRRQRRLPRQAPPRGVQRDYASAVTRLVRRYFRVLDPLRAELPRLLAEARAERARVDTAGDDVRRMIERVRAELSAALSNQQVEELAREFALKTSTFQRIQLQKQVRSALGADVFLRDPDLGPIYDAFAAENAALIRSVPTRVVDEVALIVGRGVAAATPHPDLAKEIAQKVGLGEKRAKLIARDQVGKLYGQVNAHRQRALGVTHFIWRTSNDRRVRPEHRDLEGQRFPLDVGAPGEGLPGEPVLCFPSDTRVSSQAAVEKLYRRWYCGESTVLLTDQGTILEATPNHPVLTTRGWVPAHLVDVGDDVFEAPSQGLDFGVADGQHGDPTIAEVFRALEPVGRRERRRAAGGFHGDAALDEQVDVVDMDWRLLLKGDSEFSEAGANHVLSRALETPAGLSDFTLCFDRTCPSTRGIVRSASKILALLCGHRGVAEEHRLATVAWLESVADELRSNGCTRDAEVLRHAFYRPPVGVEGRHQLARVVLGIGRRTIDRVAGLHAPRAEFLAEVVTTDPDQLGHLRDCVGLEKGARVVEKRVGHFTGYVYNLQTSSGWYVAQDLIVHNCRCYSEPDMSGILEAL